MNIINNLNFRNALFTFKKAGLLYLALLFLTVVGCKRIVSVDEAEVTGSDDKEEVSKAEIQRIMTLKLPLKTVSIDKAYSLTIPEAATFEVAKAEPGDESKIGKIGKIDLAKIPEGYLYITLNNTFTHHDELYNEYILIFKENDPKALTIQDIKDGFGEVAFVYAEDENSIVFEQG
ncbi:MAG: hypothetical protein O7C59_08405, partial [Rickettsia endosymbiont of Ixodes persulcatus]|nr:hypothetical protein [Rickettsia endosymbiont of Ixodes persulcatus]